MYRIYIAEDDESIAAAIARGLSAWDFEVRTASDFKRIADEIAEYDPHLVLLDITLPFYNGFYWCSELRRNSRVPVVFISSAADNMNIVMAMNMGGDDFIAKPFDMSVLTANTGAATADLRFRGAGRSYRAQRRKAQYLRGGAVCWSEPR